MGMTRNANDEMNLPQHGEWVRETVTVDCPRYGTSVDLLPGRLSEDRTIEYRRCDGHDVETVPYFVVKPSENTRAD